MLSNNDKGIRVKQVYSELDRKFEEQQVEQTAQTKGIPYINLYGFPVDSQALALIPEEEAIRFKAVVFFKEGRNIKLGVMDPSDRIDPLVKKLQDKSYFIEAYLISESSLNHLLEGYQKVVKIIHHSEKIEIHSNEERFHTASIADLGRKLSVASTTDIIETIFGAALNLNSSDIHIEPETENVKIRFRIDGVLQDVTVLSKDSLHQTISRIKILSKLKLNIVTAPQDGSFSLLYDTNPVDVRVSILPSAFGESIVMRILRQDKGALKFEDLGILGAAQERLMRELEKPNGMILTTGPTGSGKTTTLYAILNKLNEPGVKIITLEDPVEYRIAGLTQTPIDAKAGLTFASGLRAILRQDPDVVMVGEMRDLETAETAAQAALTGHVVLSTLHTNDAPSAIPRLLDLGVKPFVLAPAINAIIGQRLVRKICSACKQTRNLPEQLQKRVEMILKAIPKTAKVDLPKKLEFYHSPGCPKCNGIGYKGRMGVYEVFTISEKVEQLIHKQATNTEIRSQAIEEGMLTMAQDGILKALTGITDVEEVFRVTEA